MSNKFNQAQNAQNNGNLAPNGGNQPGEKPTYVPPVEKESILKKAANRIVDFGNKHPKVRKWGRRLGKAGFIGGVAYGGFKIGQHYPVEPAQVVVTSGCVEAADEPAKIEEPTENNIEVF